MQEQQQDRPRHIMQFFAFEHLPPHLQGMSKLFADAARALDAMAPEQLEEERMLIRKSQASSLLSTLRWNVDCNTPANPEATFAVIKIGEASRFLECPNGDDVAGCLRLLLEAKDCAVRALIAK